MEKYTQEHNIKKFKNMLKEWVDIEDDDAIDDVEAIIRFTDTVALMVNEIDRLNDKVRRLEKEA